MMTAYLDHRFPTTTARSRGMIAGGVAAPTAATNLGDAFVEGDTR